MITIDKDVLIYDILDKLSIQDLIHVLSTNKELRNKYLPYFQEKIEDYKEDYRYRREVAIPRQMQNFERFERIAQSFRRELLIMLDDELSSFMGLNHMPEFDNLKIYDLYLLHLWWQIYISLILGHLVTGDEVFRLTDDIADLIQVPRGTNLSFHDFLRELRNFYHRIPFTRAADEYGINEIPEDVLEALVNERRELSNILIFISQQNVRENRYPAVMNNPPTFDLLI